MSSTPSGAAAQSAALSAFARRSDLRKRIVRESFQRTNRVRRTVGYDRLPDDELDALALSALGHGFYRALIDKFSEKKGLTQDWWTEQRRIQTGHGKNRTADLAVVLDCCPEFGSYYVELTDDEVVEAAKIEFYDSIAASGTDYHQLESQRKQGGTSGDVVMLTRNDDSGAFGAVSIPDAKLAILDSEAGDIDFVDPYAQDRVENVLLHQMMTDEKDPLGPIITRVASIAFQEFGPNGLFWLIERMFLPTRHTEVLRTLAGTEAELGKAEFERVKRDMVRKLPEVNTRMIEILREDESVAQLRDLLWGERAAA